VQADAYVRRLVDNGVAQVPDWNQLAWDALFRGEPGERAVELAQTAVRRSEGRSHDVLHTLAALYAETGRLSEAHELILRALDAARASAPEPSDWYVFGRLAEQYGEREAAIAAYRKVAPPSPGEAPAASTHLLAQRRLAVLGAERR